MFLNDCKQIFHISFHIYTCVYIRAYISKSKRRLNVKSSTYYFHMKTKILADFQICFSISLKHDVFSLSRKCLNSRFNLAKWTKLIPMSASAKFSDDSNDIRIWSKFCLCSTSVRKILKPCKNLILKTGIAQIWTCIYSICMIESRLAIIQALFGTEYRYDHFKSLECCK